MNFLNAHPENTGVISSVITYSTNRYGRVRTFHGVLSEMNAEKIKCTADKTTDFSSYNVLLSNYFLTSALLPPAVGVSRDCSVFEVREPFEKCN